jgi:hypothetical protein
LEASILADTITQQLRDLGYDAMQSDEADPEPDGRARIVSGVFRSINEGHRRRFAAMDASIVVSVEINTQTFGDKPQRVKILQLDSRRIQHQRRGHWEPGVNSAAKQLGVMIADAVAEPADRNSWSRRHADRR